MALKGCDVSSYQGDIDFDKLKPQLDFIIIKASEGNSFTDAKFSRNQAEARRVGLTLGYYHFAHPDLGNTPEVEAEWFKSVLGDIHAGETLCLDFEVSYPDAVNWCLAFLRRLQSLTNQRGVIYLNQSQVKGFNWQPLIDAGFGLWLAEYDYDVNGPVPTTPWPRLAMRQYSNHETFAGINDEVDADVSYAPAPVPTPAIEQLPKDSVIRDMYTFLCGGFSDDEITWRLQQGKNLVEIGNDICGGDDRFRAKWITPNIPAPTPPITITLPEPKSFIKWLFGGGGS